MSAAVNNELTPVALGHAAPRDRASRLLSVMILCMFVPEAAGFIIFDLRFTVARFTFFLAAPFLIFAFAELIGSKRYHFVWSDLFVPLTMVWMVTALGKTEGLDSAIKTGGATALDFAMPYLAARTLMKSTDQIQRAVHLFCVVAGLAGLCGLLDVIFGYHVLREGLAHITGYQFYRDEVLPQSEFSRLGLLRAEGPLEHPIIFGVMMTYALLLSRPLLLRAKYFCWAACGLGLFLSLSSSAWQALFMGVLLIIYGRSIDFPWKWGILIGAGALGLTVFFTVMNNPLGWLFNHVTLDPSTGYFRTMIWDAAGADVMDSPIFGLGSTDDWFRPDWMGNSVDSLWLRAAMLYGIPGSVLVALCVVGANSLPVRLTWANRKRIGPRDIQLCQSLGIVSFLTLFIGFTVYYWGSVWYALGLFAGLRAALGQIATD